MSNSAIPQHIVIIPDGNRRWAKKHLLSAWHGHEAGFNRVKELCTVLREEGVKYFTLWGFSTENWNRSEEEVQKLMEIFIRALHDFEQEVHKHNIRFTHIGRKDRLPNKLVTLLSKLELETKQYTNQYFTIALDYGGRDEIVRAVNALKNTAEPVTEGLIAKHLDTKHLPDPDFIIRTSGEMRLSGIMPWQSVYAELYFTPVLFPDFDATELQKALSEFAKRQRRFGS